MYYQSNNMVEIQKSEVQNVIDLIIEDIEELGGDDAIVSTYGNIIEPKASDYDRTVYSQDIMIDSFKLLEESDLEFDQLIEYVDEFLSDMVYDDETGYILNYGSDEAPDEIPNKSFKRINIVVLPNPQRPDVNIVK